MAGPISPEYPATDVPAIVEIILVVKSIFLIIWLLPSDIYKNVSSTFIAIPAGLFKVAEVAALPSPLLVNVLVDPVPANV